VEQRLMQAEIVAHVLQPQQIDATPDRIRQLALPADFEVSKFAEGLGKHGVCLRSVAVLVSSSHCAQA
jgi:hypothetical protein